MVRVDTADMFDWLPSAPSGAVVTVLPDIAELGISTPEYEDWFTRAAIACFSASTGPTVFLQTDRKLEGHWLDKSHRLQQIAGSDPLWHRIVLKRDAGKVSIHRPGYSHILAFGPGSPGTPMADVIPPSPSLWKNGPPVRAVEMIVTFLVGQGVQRIVNPCCGEGTVLLEADRRGCEAFGCDLDPGRAERARNRLAQLGLLDPSA